MHIRCRVFFFFNDTATTEIYTLSLHDALPISRRQSSSWSAPRVPAFCGNAHAQRIQPDEAARVCLIVCALVVFERRDGLRSEEHTSELQSRQYLVCRLLLEKKNRENTPSIKPV